MVAGSSPAEDAKQEINMNKIVFKIQDKEYGFLSNFYYAPFYDEAGKLWKTVEHFYQAKKTWDSAEQLAIQEARTPKEAKHLGKTVTLRSDWNREKEGIMFVALILKFEQNSNLRTKLLETGNAELVEWAPWDEYWGAGKKGTGKNRLGVLLMKVRNGMKYLSF